MGNVKAALMEKSDTGPDPLKQIFFESRQEKKYFEGLLDSIQDPLLSLDSEHRIAWLNRPALKLLNESEKKLIGARFMESGADPELRRIFDRFARGGERIHNEEVSLSEPLPVIANVCIYPIVAEGKIQGSLLLVLDVTEDRSRLLRRMQKESIQALAGLTAGLAHEIKNPLGAVDLHIQLIQRFLKNHHFKNKEELEEMTRVLSDEIHRLDAIVNDFLFSVRPIRSKKKREALNDVVEEVIVLMAPEFVERKVELEKELTAELPELWIDRNYMKQAIINVLKNAMEAMDAARSANPGRSARLRVSTAMEEDRLILSVKDSGVGISQKNLTKIFEPFFTTKEMGTGLGLTIVYRIVQENGGEIVIHSEEGKGTDFRMEFPTHTREPKLIGSETQA